MRDLTLTEQKDQTYKCENMQHLPGSLVWYGKQTGASSDPPHPDG